MTLYIWIWDNENWGIGKTEEDARLAAHEFSQECREEGPRESLDDDPAMAGKAVKLEGDEGTIRNFLRYHWPELMTTR